MGPAASHPEHYIEEVANLGAAEKLDEKFGLANAANPLDGRGYGDLPAVADKRKQPVDFSLAADETATGPKGNAEFERDLLHFGLGSSPAPFGGLIEALGDHAQKIPPPSLRTKSGDWPHCSKLRPT